MKFHVKWTADFIQEDGSTKFPDIGKDGIIHTLANRLFCYPAIKFTIKFTRSG